MAIYQSAAYLQQMNHQAFNVTHKAGDTAPHSGIYRCDVCGHDAVSTAGNTLPPQGGAHTHASHTNPIAWRLVVAAEHG